MKLFFAVCALLVGIPAGADTIVVDGFGALPGTVMFEKGSFYLERTWIDRGTPSPARHSFVLKIPEFHVKSVEFNETRSEVCESICKLPPVGSVLESGIVQEVLPVPTEINVRKSPTIPVYPEFTPEVEKRLAAGEKFKGNVYERSWEMFAIGDEKVHLMTLYSDTCFVTPKIRKEGIVRLKLREPSAGAPASAAGAR